MSGFYDEDGMYIHTDGTPDDELQVIIEWIQNGNRASNHDRETLILAGYNPDTGEYNE